MVYYRKRYARRKENGRKKGGGKDEHDRRKLMVFLLIAFGRCLSIDIRQQDRRGWVHDRRGDPPGKTRDVLLRLVIGTSTEEEGKIKLTKPCNKVSPTGRDSVASVAHPSVQRHDGQKSEGGAGVGGGGCEEEIIPLLVRVKISAEAFLKT